MTDLDQLALIFEAELVSKHGQLLPPSVLPALLGYRSIDAFRKAVSRRTVPVAVFRLENRRGTFALAKDVARWLSQRRFQAIEPLGVADSESAGEGAAVSGGPSLAQPKPSIQTGRFANSRETSM